MPLAHISWAVTDNVTGKACDAFLTEVFGAKPGWNPQWWRDSHPLGIEGLQSIGVSTPSLDTAREIFTGKLGWPELSSRYISDDAAESA